MQPLANVPRSGVRGTPSGTYVEGTSTYTSSIDGFTLGVRFCYDPGFQQHALIQHIHGFSQTYADFSAQDGRYLAAKGALVCQPSLRGRDGSGGSQDASGVEQFDVYDCMIWARGNFPTCSPDIANVFGHSGGGGTALALCRTMPDAFGFYCTHSAISDYGFDPIDSWYQEGNTVPLSTWAGTRTTANLDIYRVRNARESAPTWMKYSQTRRLLMYHDALDSTVRVTHSRLMNAAMTAGSALCEYIESPSGGPTGYTHGLPHDSPGIVAAAPHYLPLLLSTQGWTIPTVGDAIVSGWVKTKRFEIWTGPTASPSPKTDLTNGRKKRVLHVSWDIGANIFLVQPLNGACYVQIILANGHTATILVDKLTAISPG